MRLNGISIENYRTIYDIKLKFSQKKPVNIFIGKNGSGKSNILSAINQIFYGLFFREVIFQKTDHSIYSSDAIKIEANILHDDKDLWVKLYKTDENKNPPTYAVKITGEPSTKDIGYYIYIPSDRFTNERIYFNRNASRGLRDRFQITNNRYDDFLRDYYNLSIDNPDELKKLSKKISHLYPGLEELYMAHNTKEDHSILNAIIYNQHFSFDKLSSGLQQLITMIVTISQSKKRVIVIDEPELHMNPSMIIGLAEIIYESAIERENQFIIGTHSSEFITHPKFNIFSLELKKDDKRWGTTQVDNPEREFVKNTFFSEG